MAAVFGEMWSRGRRAVLRTGLGLTVFRLTNRGKSQFRCPICRYVGPFDDAVAGTGTRRHARCPRCGSLERHRLQYLTIERLATEADLSEKSLLHFAPEPFLEAALRKTFKHYTSADLRMRNVDYRADLLALPFENDSYDLVLASHVLEHVRDDAKALSEISRVLKPDGIAILPVPIVADKTIEYPEPGTREAGHVRAPGPDYFERYLRHFRSVETFDSADFPWEYQVFVYEDRTEWARSMPWRSAAVGDRHVDIVPVCYKGIRRKDSR